jgi:hypothetical protein
MMVQNPDLRDRQKHNIHASSIPHSLHMLDNGKFTVYFLKDFANVNLKYIYQYSTIHYNVIYTDM